jgi:Flp pilus assembly protein TadG
MNRPGFSWLADRRGIAAVEFALIAPILLAMLGGVTDFGLLMSGKSKLANGLAQGVQSALMVGPSVSAATVRAAVQNGAARSGMTSTVAVTVTGPACYCVTGRPAVLSAPPAALSATFTCPGTCPVTAAAPGAFMIVVASYLYQPLMPFYSQLVSPTVSETITVQLR